MLIINTFQFGRIMEKLNIRDECNPEYCNVKFKVLVHESIKSLVKDIRSKPLIYIGFGDTGKKFMIEKSTLDLISTTKDPCSSDSTLIRLDCRLKVVSIKMDS